MLLPRRTAAQIVFTDHSSSGSYVTMYPEMISEGALRETFFGSVHMVQEEQRRSVVGASALVCITYIYIAVSFKLINHIRRSKKVARYEHAHPRCIVRKKVVYYNEIYRWC